MIRTPQLPQLNLASHQYDRPFFVDMEAFFDFSFWLAEELLELESQFKVTRRLEPAQNLSENLNV